MTSETIPKNAEAEAVPSERVSVDDASIPATDNRP